MPRRSAGARLYFEKRSGRFIIRDGSVFKRTGFGRGERKAAEDALAEYIANRVAPPPKWSRSTQRADGG